MKKKIYINRNGKKITVEEMIRRMRKNKLEKFEKLAKVYKKNKKTTVISLCREFNMNNEEFSKFLIFKKITIRNGYEDIRQKCKKAAEEYKKNKKRTLNNICDEFSINYETISKYLKFKSIPIRPHRIHFFDEHYYDIIDTEEKAYTLGVIVADGNINKAKTRITIGLKRTDKKYLNKIAKIFNSPLKDGKTYLKITNKTYKQSILSINSVILANSLIKKGITPRKSLTMTDEVFNYIPDEFLPAFIRGYFDGDGTVGIYKNNEGKMGFCGTYKFLNRIRNIFEEKIGTNKNVKICKSGKINTLSYGGNLQLISIREWLYGKNPIMFLERKKIIFDSIKTKKRCKNKTSKYRGVCWNEEIKKWEIYITTEGEHKCLGYFKSEIKAARYYDKAVKKYKLPKYKLNFP